MLEIKFKQILILNPILTFKSRIFFYNLPTMKKKKYFCGKLKNNQYYLFWYSIELLTLLKSEIKVIRVI